MAWEKGRDKREERRGRKGERERERETSAFATANQTFLPQANAVVPKSISERKITEKRWTDELNDFYHNVWGHMSRIFGRERVTFKMGCTRIM